MTSFGRAGTARCRPSSRPRPDVPRTVIGSGREDAHLVPGWQYLGVMRGRLILLVAALVALATGCRLDVDVAVQMDDDGAGAITVTAVADAELVAAAPGLADDLRLDDFRNAGWTVEGPTATDGGGLRVVVSHAFASPDEATGLLAGLNGPNGPFQGLTLHRTVDGSTVTYAADGTLQLVGGIDAFSDAYVQSLGAGTPFAATLATRGEPLASDLGIDLSITLPVAAETDGTLAGDAATWQVPLDGTSTTVTASGSTTSSHTGARVLATLALVVFVAWIALAAAFVVYVARNRRRPALRR